VLARRVVTKQSSDRTPIIPATQSEWDCELLREETAQDYVLDTHIIDESGYMRVLNRPVLCVLLFVVVTNPAEQSTVSVRMAKLPKARAARTAAGVLSLPVMMCLRASRTAIRRRGVLMHIQQ
jgi:hypothetical protein